MKTHGLIHGQLLRLVAELGADDSFALGHRGMSARPGQEFVDLAFAPGQPALLDVLDAILPEVHASAILIPDWLEERAPDWRNDLIGRLGHDRAQPTQPALLLQAVDRARFVVRTGEEFPITIAIRSGWPWNEQEESWRTGAPRPARSAIDDL
jgi:D-ribose pyranase